MAVLKDTLVQGDLSITGTAYGVGSTLYGTCATAAATAAKVVNDMHLDKLVTGITIYVKFTYSNTVANPTLNINGLGAKTIYRYGTTAPSTSAKTSWNAGSVVAFTYDGTYWQMVGWLNDDTNTTTGTSYNAGSCPDNTTFGTNGSIARVYTNIGTRLNRTDASVNTANTSYGTAMARAIYAGTTDMTAGTTALTNGVIYLYYEA